MSAINLMFFKITEVIKKVLQFTYKPNLHEWIHPSDWQLTFDNQPFMLKDNRSANVSAKEKNASFVFFHTESFLPASFRLTSL